MSYRKLFYSILNENDHYLPPCSDKSLTKKKLILLCKGESICPNNRVVKHVDIKPSASCSVLVEQIVKIIGGDREAFWFLKGRLPPKWYLVDVLYALDSSNPALGKTINMKRTRRKEVNDKCTRCLTYFKSKLRRLRIKKKQPPVMQPLIAPLDIRLDLSLREKMRLLFVSRFGWLTIKRARNDAAFEKFDLDSAHVQLAVQKEISLIDGLIERWKAIP